MFEGHRAVAVVVVQDLRSRDACANVSHNDGNIDQMGRERVYIHAILTWGGNVAGESVLVRKGAFDKALLAGGGHLELQRALEIQGENYPPQLHASSFPGLGQMAQLRSMEFGNVGLADSDAEQIVCVARSVALHRVKDHENLAS